MNQIVTYLESKQAIFHGALVLMMLYVPHAGHLFMQLEHLDMTFAGYSFLNWFYGVAIAAVIEFLILIFLINGYRKTGKFYAVVSFFLNFFYYDYWFISIQSPTSENIKTTIISLFICLTHSLAIWQLSELFYKRLQDDKNEFFCDDCGAGPFPSRKALEGHISKSHRYKRKTEPVRVNGGAWQHTQLIGRTCASSDYANCAGNQKWRELIHLSCNAQYTIEVAWQSGDSWYRTGWQPFFADCRYAGGVIQMV